MGKAVFEMPQEVCILPETGTLGTLGAFFQPSTTSERNLVRSDERLLRELVSVLDRQLLVAVETHSETEFCTVRANVISRYVRALRALQDTASNLVSDDMVERISDSIVTELAADLQKQEDRFGSKLCEQAVFTLWTVGKIRALGHEILAAGDAPAEKKEADVVLFSEYRAASLWSQFHLDVLFAAMKFDRPVREEIRPVVCEGLRAAVNAYAIMKDALSLRRPRRDDLPTLSLPWDAEDDQLLASSMKDVNDDFSKCG